MDEFATIIAGISIISSFLSSGSDWGIGVGVKVEGVPFFLLLAFLYLLHKAILNEFPLLLKPRRAYLAIP